MVPAGSRWPKFRSPGGSSGIGTDHAQPATGHGAHWGGVEVFRTDWVRLMATEQRPEDYGIGRLFWVTSDAIVGADIESERIVLWNPAAEDLFGYSAHEAVGMALVDIVAPAFRDAHLRGIRRYRDGEPAVLVGKSRVEVPAVTKDGVHRDVALTLTDVSHAGSRRHVVAVIRDITDIRDAQRELEQMNESMREFVATASHDLRTPLATILGFAQLLTTDGAALSEVQRQEYTDAILRGALRATRLVDDLLTLSQIQAGALASHIEVVDVAGVAGDAVETSGVAATISIDPGLAVQVDRHQLERMLTNLLSNAERHGRPPVTIHATCVGDVVEITVTDAGDGVPEQFVPRLFDRFARASKTGPGTGLGLSIVQGLAASHGGDVIYDSSSIGGARFTVRLPMSIS